MSHETPASTKGRTMSLKTTQLIVLGLVVTNALSLAMCFYCLARANAAFSASVLSMEMSTGTAELIGKILDGDMAEDRRRIGEALDKLNQSGR